MNSIKYKTIKYKDLSDKYKINKVLMPDGTLAYPDDDTLIRVDENGVPLDYSKLKEGNFAEVNEDGSYTAAERLPEITVTPKQSLGQKTLKWINDNILLNPNNIRGNNMERATSTPSGLATINNIRDGQNIAAGTIVAAATLPVLPALTNSTALEIAGSMIGSSVVDSGSKALTGKTWGENVSDITGLHPFLAEMTNPGGIWGGFKGNFIKSNNLIPKFFKGDLKLGWSNLTDLKNHWLFKGGATPTNILMAATNRLVPFLSNIERSPFRVLAYQAGKRSKGNPSIGIRDLFAKSDPYTGTTIPGVGKNNLAFYMFRNDPIIKHTPWFRDIASKFKPASKKYLKRVDGEEYYQMNTVIPQGDYINFKSVDDLLNYAPIGKPVVKDTGMLIPLGDDIKIITGLKGNKVGTIDDLGNHRVLVFKNKNGEIIHTQMDRFDFDTNYAYNNSSLENLANFIRTGKQGYLMDKMGTPYWNYSWNRVSIGGDKLYAGSEYVPQYFNSLYRKPHSLRAVTLQHGGSIPNKLPFQTYTITNSKDERTPENEEIKVDITPYNFFEENLGKYIQNWDSSLDIGEMLNPEEVEEPEIDYSFIDRYSKYSFNRDFNYRGYNEFNNAFQEASSKDLSDASITPYYQDHYRELLYALAQQESSYNPAIEAYDGTPAYGYFQLLERGDVNNITDYYVNGLGNPREGYLENFKKDPIGQIRAAARLMADNERALSSYFSRGEQQGYSKYAMLAAAWLGGVQGVKNYFDRGRNPSDGNGTTIKNYLDLFNYIQD